ncbi:PSP1 C-terminal conserved region family protein [Leishmania donovani]|uniref:PSP1 C-terminal conserved region family protein n=1 Tax=Leishmania donovani TaxID=5661 RepID=A0A504XFH3_LEIDO|nr:PSP1 C-terminal conserved region family protein [Leishmania donovani]
MAYTESHVNKAIDVFLDTRSGSPPAVTGANATVSNNTVDHNRFATMIALQNRLLSIMAEAQTIVQHLQQNGFFPRGSGANPEEDAANIIMQMLRASLEASNSSRLAIGHGHRKRSAVPSPNSTNMPAGLDDVSSWAPTKSSPDNNSHSRSDTDNAIHSAVSHNALPEGSEMLAFVEFKRGRVRKYVCGHRIEPGNYVLVDGDRGTDCGLLVQTIERKPNNETAVVSMEGCDIRDDKIKLENGRVLRQASEEDIDRLHNIIANAESVALKTCRQRCLELGIDIDLQDVEYQFDMKKISFFFDCDHSVDFRSLVRELYRTFGARIWMENINPKVKNSMPDASGHERGHGGGHHGNGGGWRNNHRGGRGRDY